MPHPQPATRPTISYGSGVRLSVPVIADSETIHALYTAAQTTAVAELRAVAEDLGLTPPTEHHTWAIGWTGPVSEPDRRLVWYDPDKLHAIDAMIDRITAEHPDLTAMIVIQGACWDDWVVAFTADDLEAEDDPGTAGGETGIPAASGDSSTALDGSEGRDDPKTRLVDVPLPQPAHETDAASCKDRAGPRSARKHRDDQDRSADTGMDSAAPADAADTEVQGQ